MIKILNDRYYYILNVWYVVGCGFFCLILYDKVYGFFNNL